MDLTDEVMEDEVPEEGYEDTLAEVDRRLSDANAHLQTETRELDVLEYSMDHEDTAGYEVPRASHDVDHVEHPEIAHDDDAYEDDHHEDDGDEEEEEEEEEDTDDEGKGEEGLEPSSEAQGKEQTTTGAEGRTHVYENKFTKPVLKLGKTTVSVGEAKLYGLLDKDGKVRLDAKKGKENTRTRSEAKGTIDALVKKKDSSQVKPEAEDEDIKECRFKPQRSKKAARAMRNPSCGYDFVSRLEEKGGFMERNGGHPAPKADNRSESAKEDYEASLDKLQCPKCRKYQSFDEFVEKRRSCGPCQERYVRLNVANMNSWKQRQAEAERKKQQRLKQIEDDFYGDASFAPKLNKNASGTGGKRTLSLTERTTALMEKQKAEAQEAKAVKERERLAFEEKQRLQAAAARANRAAAKKQELEMLKSGTAKPVAGERPKSGRGAGSGGKGAGAGKLNRTAPASGLPHTGSSARVQKKKEKEDRAVGSFNKTDNNISAKFDLLLN